MLEPTISSLPTPSPASSLPVVHAVTSDEIVSRDDFIDVACAVMAALGPRGALHLRAGRISAARLQTLAGGLEAAQAITGAWLIVNDRVDLALGARARGAQLTSRSLRTSGFSPSSKSTSNVPLPSCSASSTESVMRPLA